MAGTYDFYLRFSREVSPTDLSRFFPHGEIHVLEGPRYAVLRAEKGYLATIDQDIASFALKRGNVGVLCCPFGGSFRDELSMDSLRFFPNRCCFPSDVILRAIGFGDFSFYAGLSKLFKNIDDDLMLTYGAYLRCGMDGLLAAKSLNIHRNTFSYRLKALQEKTGLDIRDYHDALLLEIYFDLTAGRY